MAAHSIKRLTNLLSEETMLLVLARNISPPVEGKLAPVSDYDVSVAINNLTIWRGTVRGHRRDAGWRALLRLISNAKGDSVEDARHRAAARIVANAFRAAAAMPPLPDDEDAAAVSVEGVAGRAPIRAGETVCEHGLRPFECWSCRSCHPVD